MKLHLKILLTLFAIVMLTMASFLLLPKSTSQPVLEPRDEVRTELPKEEEKEVTLIAVGDIMLSRNVAAKIRAYDDINYPFLQTRDLLRKGDIVFANLEAPITEGPIVKTGDMSFHADPGVEVALRDAGFNLVSLANNHTPNYGQKGLLDTFKLLTEADIKYVGAGANAAEAEQAIFIEKGGVRFAFLAYNDSDVVPANYLATANRAGTNFMDTKKMVNAVAKAKQDADLVIVSMHSGTEYSVPNQRQINFAHAAIDSGADLIIGHHPHVLQRVEQYKGKYILYSLGNFVFDQMFSLETRQSVIVELKMNKQGVQDIEFIPAMIYDYAQPRIIEASEAKEAIYKRLEVK
jgi:poly-gamma-glutamate capsule biosynthesis protein CapA/YwtB (metallophosphatase superfamily)